ncbi:energy transducer TonB [Candidatus Paracaedibacter symbiosus]|uniref:energy transducer TonB n=1 Tax=Candidatus Paracaedibacter symbiosus TaxID=244582 RepID=UPI000509F7A6|nr:energy transducer TonB [Candidatus Paracaedibacter symbiosus]
MWDLKQHSKIVILSPLNRIWPFGILAALLHGVALAGWMLPKQGSDLAQIEPGYPVTIVHFEEIPPPEPVSAPPRQEKKKDAISVAKEKIVVEGESESTKAASLLSAQPPLQPQAGNPHPPYPEDAREQGLEGRVVAVVTVAMTGVVEAVEIIAPRAHEFLEKSVLKVVKQWRFQPLDSPTVRQKTFHFDFCLQ